MNDLAYADTIPENESAMAWLDSQPFDLSQMTADDLFTALHDYLLDRDVMRSGRDLDDVWETL